MKRIVLPILIVCLVALIAPAAVSALTYEEAVDDLVASGYTRDAEDYLTSLGTDPKLGFRLAGTSAEHAASDYVFDELDAMGLSPVLEAVPVDAWDFGGATVTVGGRVFIASSFAGVPGTGGPLGGDLVYVGAGTAAEFDAAGDVTGKLVLVDGEFDDWWLNFVGAEATLRGAAGVVMTYGENTYPWYSYPEALGGNDGEYDDDWVPMVYVAWQDGDWIKTQLTLAGGSLPATMTSDVTITLAENGGVGYNVVGVLEGSEPDLAPVLLASHLDAHFRAGQDDTGAVVNELLTAKAMTESGVQPRRTVIFFFTCAEEYGYTDCWYDWAIGAWYAITEEHPDWAGKLAMMLNIESMAETDSSLRMRGAADVMPFLESVAAASSDVLPYGYEGVPTPSTWTDQWSWNASGVPTVTTSAGGADYDRYYHTDLETKDRVDHDYLGGIAKFNYRVIEGLDAGVLPYDLRARGDQLLSTIKSGKLVRAGVSQPAAARFKAAATKFRAAAWQWELRKARTPKGKIAAVNDEARGAREDGQRDVHEPRCLGLHRLPPRAGRDRLDLPDEGDHRRQDPQRGARAADAQLVRRDQLVRQPVQPGGVQGGSGAPLSGLRARHLGRPGYAAAGGRLHRRVRDARRGGLRRRHRGTEGGPRVGEIRPAGPGREHDQRPERPDQGRQGAVIG